MNTYNVIHPGTIAFESCNPGAFILTLCKAKSAGSSNTDPKIAWHESVVITGVATIRQKVADIVARG